MRSFFATLSSIARGLRLRDASTTIILSAAVLVTGCGGGGSGTTKGPQTPVITWNTPSAITYGTALSSTQLNATANVSGAFAYTPAAGTTPTAGTQTLSAAFTPTDTTDYTSADATVQLTVSQATPTISTPPTATAITSGDALSASTLSGGAASVQGTFAWTTPSTIPATGTDSEGVTFTPTDATDYTTATTTVQVLVNPATPQITGFTIAGSQYAVQDGFSNTFIPLVMACSGCLSGDIVSTTVAGSTYTSNLPGTADTYYSSINFIGSDGEPTPVTNSVQHPGGLASNSWSVMYLGSASQSTLAISATTGTAFHVEQASGQTYYRTTGGTTGTLSGTTGGTAQTPNFIAVDDVSGNIAYLFTGGAPYGPLVEVYDENKDNICYIITGMASVSSIAAKGGYMVFTDPVDNEVGIAKMDCTGYITVPVAGQPWAVAMSGSDAFILSRDDAGNGLPRVTKIGVPSGTTEGFVDLTGVPTVTSIRNTTPYEGIYQLAAFNTTPVASVLFMSDATDGSVLTISTDTSNGATMAATNTTPISDLPVIIAPQENGSVTKPVLWVGYFPADTGGNVMQVGALDPATGNYTPVVGACQAGLVGGFAASANGLQCSGGEMISAPLALPYSTY